MGLFNGSFEGKGIGRHMCEDNMEELLPKVIKEGGGSSPKASISQSACRDLPELAPQQSLVQGLEWKGQKQPEPERLVLPDPLPQPVCLQAVVMQTFLTRVSCAPPLHCGKAQLIPDVATRTRCLSKICSVVETFS